MRSDENYIVVGLKGKNVATRNALFGDVANGAIPNARYVSAAETAGFFRKVMMKVLGKLGDDKGIGNRLNRLTNVPTRTVEAMFAKDKKNIVVYVPSTRIFLAYQNNMPITLRKRHPDCKQVFYLIDGVERTAFICHISVEQFLEYLKRFDAVATYDRVDAEKYGFYYVDEPLWHSKAEQPDVPDYDLYFCGRSKKRAALMSDIMVKAEKQNVRCSYHVIAPPEGEELIPGVTYSKWVYYYDIVDELLKSNCILDINAEFNTGLTLRCKEAVIYNKKLLTNNPEIREFKYYDPRWMKVFETSDDIDYEWIAKREDVRYGYKNEYSVQTFLTTISDIVGNRS